MNNVAGHDPAAEIAVPQQPVRWLDRRADCEKQAFFFLDYEGQRETLRHGEPGDGAGSGGAGNGNEPGDPAAGGHDPWPAVPGGGTVPVIAPSYNNLTSWIGKVDYNINANNLLTGRYFYGDSKQSFPLALTGGGILPGYNTYTPTRVQLVSLSYVSVIRPNLVNEARMGWNRFAEGFFPEDQAFAPSSIGLNTGEGVADMGLPVISVDGYAQLGANKNDPRHRFDTNWQAFDNVSWTHGPHSFKFGYEYRRTSINQYLDINFRGKLEFDSLQDFLSGTVDGGGQSSGDTTRHSAQNNQGLYAQDTWRLSPKVTANLGLRWDYYGIFHEENNLLSNITNFDPTGTDGDVDAGGAAGVEQAVPAGLQKFCAACERRVGRDGQGADGDSRGLGHVL